MKRRSVLLLFCLVVAVFVLTGCQLIHKNETQKSTDTSKISKQTVSEVYYTDLSKADRAKFNFAFKATEDSTGAPNPGEEDTIRMAVTNHTNKIVQFDRSKFMIFADAEHKKVSKLTGLLTVKPGETKKITEIFDHVNGQFLVGAGIFLYLNQHYPLAYTYYAFRKDGVTSANLTDKKLIKINTPHQESQESSQGDARSSTQSANDSSSSSQENDEAAGNSTAGSTQSTVITNAAQAIALMAHADSVIADTLTAKPVAGGWLVTQKETGALTCTVHPDGSATWDDGTTQSYAELSAPTTSGNP